MGRNRDVGHFPSIGRMAKEVLRREGRSSGCEGKARLSEARGERGSATKYQRHFQKGESTYAVAFQLDAREKTCFVSRVMEGNEAVSATQLGLRQ